MHRLVPFQQTLPFGLEADLTMQTSLITIRFQLDLNLMSILGLPSSSFLWTAQDVPRMDELWKTTCFESFLKPKDLNSYYEFNFSLVPAWNVYEFTDYRKPQPPTPSQDFALQSMSWNSEKRYFTAEVENKTVHREFQVSLTAVIENSDHDIHYWAVTHAEREADFHAPETFTLNRSI
jgi:hypothetical protein